MVGMKLATGEELRTEAPVGSVTYFLTDTLVLTYKVLPAKFCKFVNLALLEV
jgi:hypothetical protein